MSKPKSAHYYAHLQYSEQGIPFVLATKSYPRRLVYILCSENNSRSSQKEQSTFIIETGRYCLKLNEKLPSKGEYCHREN